MKFLMTLEFSFSRHPGKLKPQFHIIILKHNKDNIHGPFLSFIISHLYKASEITWGLLIQFQCKYQGSSLKVLKMTTLNLEILHTQSGLKLIIYLLEITFELEEVTLIIQSDPVIITEKRNRSEGSYLVILDWKGELATNQN